MQNPCDKVAEKLKTYYESFGDLRFSKAVMSGDYVDLYFVSNVALTDFERGIIKAEYEKNLAGFKITVHTKKSLADGDIAKHSIFEYVKNNCFSVAHTFDEEDVKIISANKKIKYEISVIEGVKDYFDRTNLIKTINETMQREFANDFEGSVTTAQFVTKKIAPYKPSVAKAYNDAINLRVRHVTVKDVVRCCDSEFYDTATYIEDGEDKLGTIYFAGKVTEIEKKQSKKGNDYYRITINDKTGSVTGSFFTADKQKLAKLEKVKEESVIILRGENEEYGGRVSLLIKGFHFCEFPDNYVPEEKASKVAEEKYRLIFPEPCETTKQNDFFSQEITYPDFILNTEFVVTDLETSGTDQFSDKITEIGAVRIKNGVIVETFTTLVNAEVSLSKKNVELTGITEDMLVDKPKIHEVFPDFFKFLGDGVFVGHNADFDYRFLKRDGAEQGYYLRNKVLDTLEISREVLPFLNGHKLNMVCAHYEIEFRHHRALSDAFATAELLLELSKDKKSHEIIKKRLQ